MVLAVRPRFTIHGSLSFPAIPVSLFQNTGECVVICEKIFSRYSIHFCTCILVHVVLLWYQISTTASAIGLQFLSKTWKHFFCLLDNTNTTWPCRSTLFSRSFNSTSGATAVRNGTSGWIKCGLWMKLRSANNEMKIYIQFFTNHIKRPVLVWCCEWATIWLFTCWLVWSH